MSDIHVSYAEMRDAANMVTSAQAEMSNMLLRLRNSLSDLVSGGYVTAQSSKAFDESYTRYNQHANGVIQTLEEVSTYLKTAADTMEATDTELAAKLR